MQDGHILGPVGVVHLAAVHAGAAAVGALGGQRHLLRRHAQKSRQLHQQGGDLAAGKVGLHQRQHRVEQAVQLQRGGGLDLVQHRLDDGALPLDAHPIVVHRAQPGILQGGIAVHVVDAGGHLDVDLHRVGGDLPVQGGGFLLGQGDVHAAHRVDDLHKGVEVDAHVVVHHHVEAFLHRVHGQLGAAVAEGMGDPVVLALIAIQQDGHAGAALDGHQLDGILGNVQRDQDQAVGAGVVAELGGGGGAVQLVQVGVGVIVVDGLGALVGADQQDVQHVGVLEGAAFGHDHLAGVFLQAGGVQVLVLLGADAAHRVHGAVIVVDQVQLAVDVQRRHAHQHRRRAHNAQQHLAPQGDAAFGFGRGRVLPGGFGRRVLAGDFIRGIVFVMRHSIPL